MLSCRGGHGLIGGLTETDWVGNCLTDRPINWLTQWLQTDARTDGMRDRLTDRLISLISDFCTVQHVSDILLENISFWLDSFTWWNVHTCVILTFGSLFMYDKTPSLAPWSLMAFSNALLLLSKQPLDPLQVMSNVCVAFSLNSRRKFSCVFPTPV